MYDAANAEEYGEFQENGFKSVSDAPLSTFSIDVDAASYSNMRRFINKGELPPVDAIRTEELVNYFSYDYLKPTGSDPVKNYDGIRSLSLEHKPSSCTYRPESKRNPDG